MSNKKKKGRAVDGILLLDKPCGISSNAALQRVKRIFNAQKAGHTGSLDPLATGMLPVCLGQATKVSSYLLEADKVYQVSMKLGEKTTTADAEGEVIEKRPVEDYSLEYIETVLQRFRGELEQIPPMHSALKHQGQPLYRLARQGIEVERKARKVTIQRLDLIVYENDTMQLDVACTKGTYVRTLVEDMGEVLGCGAHVTALRRTQVAGFQPARMVTMEKLEEAGNRQNFEQLDALLLPIEAALAHFPEVSLARDLLFYLRRGQAVLVPHAPTQGWVRLYGENALFVGIGRVLDDGRIAPQRLVNM